MELWGCEAAAVRIGAGKSTATKEFPVVITSNSILSDEKLEALSSVHCIVQKEAEHPARPALT
jgi:hypothetical protein